MWFRNEAFSIPTLMNDARCIAIRFSSVLISPQTFVIFAGCSSPHIQSQTVHIRHASTRHTCCRTHPTCNTYVVLEHASILRNPATNCINFIYLTTPAALDRHDTPQ